MFFNLLNKFHLIISEHQFILFLDEIMQFEEAYKYLAFLYYDDLSILEPFVRKSFDLEENSNLLKPVLIIEYCLSMPL